MAFPLPAAELQLPLIHVVESDDQLLLQTEHAEWYRVLHDFAWQDYRDVAAAYYDALYQFNLEPRGIQKSQTPETSAKDAELKEEAKQRLLFDRPTMDKTASILFEAERPPSPPKNVNPASIAPGVVPLRMAGRKHKCFFALLESFLGVSLMGFPPEPETVHLLLTSNLSFARVCGFVPKTTDDAYWYRFVPSLRKLQQFDQVMRDFGLWDRIKWDEVQRNIEAGVIQPENELVGDTTHYYAYSAFETVRYIDDDGKEKKKSQSKTTKACRCEDWKTCPHPWQLADDGAGTIVKSGNKMYWGHKSSVIGLPRQGIPLDAVAVADAATFDGKTLLPHLERLFEYLPDVKPWIDRVLYDSACNDRTLKQTIKDQFDIELKASLNPRRRKTVTDNLPRGMDKLTPYGALVCLGGCEMEYIGVRYNNEKFIYQAPVDANGKPVCETCEFKTTCCPNAIGPRVATIAFDQLPHIDPDDPPMAKRFKAIMQRRPSVERMIKRLKCDMSDDTLSKRSNASFQAYLDKSMIAFHILLRA